MKPIEWAIQPVIQRIQVPPPAIGTPVMRLEQSPARSVASTATVIARSDAAPGASASAKRQTALVKILDRLKAARPRR